jgi:hypothetical protein
LDLFRQLGLPPAPDGPQHVGEGVVLYEARSPASLSHARDGAELLRGWCAAAARAAGIDWQESPALVLHRGPYVVAAVLPSATAPVVLSGRFIPLFEPSLPVVNHVVIRPNQRQLLVDLDRLSTPRPCVVAASGRVSGETRFGGDLSFSVRGIDDTPCLVRVACEAAPSSVAVGGNRLLKSDWFFADGVLRIHFENAVDAQVVDIKR